MLCHITLSNVIAFLRLAEIGLPLKEKQDLFLNGRPPGNSKIIC